VLSGQRVGLRAIEPGDLEPLRGWRNDPSLRRYFREFRELTAADQRDWYERIVLPRQGTLMFSVVELASDRLLGAAGLCAIDWVRRSADLSLYIGADGLYIDDTFAPDALRLLLDYAFCELGLHRVWSEVYEFDTAKAALYAQFQLPLEGRHREHHFAEGRWHDSLFYGLLASEFDSITKEG
jgi:RimJ/RimL family protein N-acetyltransferase